MLKRLFKILLIAITILPCFYLYGMIWLPIAIMYIFFRYIITGDFDVDFIAMPVEFYVDLFDF
jgi:hypothetical protein